MLKSLAIACLLVVGCKADKPDAPAGSAAEQAGAAGGAKPRSGKVDFGLHRGSGTGGASEATDGSGDPAREVMAERRKARMAAMDTDGDGQISADERKAARARRAEDLRKRLDVDGDGKLTTDELAKSQFRRFDPVSVDADKDGLISSDELTKALETQGRAWGMGRFRGRPGAGPGSGTPAPSRDPEE